MPHKDPAVRRAYQQRRYAENKHLWKHQDGSWKKGDPDRRRQRMRRRYREDQQFREKHNARQRAATAAKARHGACEICKREPPSYGTAKERQLVRDHCHKTGQTRGWICMSCNLALGHAKDSPEILRAMAVYLEKNETGSMAVAS